MILPLDSEGPASAARYRLVWRMRLTSRLDIVQYFIDASTGATVLQYSDRQSQSAVGRARGVLGDSKKISASASGSISRRATCLRPPAIETYDMKGDPVRTDDVPERARARSTADDIASDDRQQLDRRRRRRRAHLRRLHLRLLLQALRPARPRQQQHPDQQPGPIRCAALDLRRCFDDFADFFLNAFYAGGGVMVYGDGLPPGLHARRPVVGLPLRRARHRRARADPRRHRIHART